jgi:hypothetical protein
LREGPYDRRMGDVVKMDEHGVVVERSEGGGTMRALAMMGSHNHTPEQHVCNCNTTTYRPETVSEGVSEGNTASCVVSSG